MDRPDVLQRLSLTDCPDHRLRMVKFAQSERAARCADMWWGERSRIFGIEDIGRHVAAGQLWWVSQDMELLVEAAADSIPDFRLMPGDVPDPCGVVFYERPLVGIDSHAELGDDSWQEAVDTFSRVPGPMVYGGAPFDGTVALNAMSWSSARRADGSGTLVIYSWVFLVNGLIPGWLALGVCTWDLGTSLRDVRDDYEDAHKASVTEDRGRLAALWLLASQERLARRSEEPVERHAAKRHVRAGLEIPTLKVLRLRHARTTKPDEEPSESRAWTHRWVVSGHWRNQWLPSEDRHRPTWIAPYVKGPDDKPLVVKDSIKALVQ